MGKLEGEYLGYFFLDLENVRSLSLGAIWNFGKGTGLPWLGIRLWGTTGLSKGLGASGPDGVKPNHYSILFYMDVKDLHSRTGRDEKKEKIQEKMERGSRKRSSSAGSEKKDRVGGR